jgi:YcxB-like protein
MKITYENTPDDMVTFNMYVYRHSPSQRRIRAIIWLGFPVLFICIGIYFATTSRSVDPFFWYGIPAVIWALVIPRIYDNAVANRVRKLCREGSLRGFVGSHELELLDGKLVSRDETSTSTTDFKGIERIVETETHAYIFLNSLMAIVIPRALLIAGDLQAMLQEIAAKGQIPHTSASRPD